MRILPKPITVIWDQGNLYKNFKKHKVTVQETEEMFASEPLTLVTDNKHSTAHEKRYQALGKTKSNRKLFAAFIIRDGKIRIISIRDMSKKKGVSMKNLKPIPKFKNLEEEAEFWDTHDSTEYVDWSKAEKTIFPNLKPSTESISLRLPSPLLARIKGLANEKDVPYQSLMKVYLSERVEQERKTVKSK